MEIWIASGTKKGLRKRFPFIRDYAVIDIKEIANLLGYETTIDLDDHRYYVLSAEIQKRLVAINSSRRFFRVLYIVEELNCVLPQSLLNYSLEENLQYDKVYVLEKDEFELQLSAGDMTANI